MLVAAFGALDADEIGLRMRNQFLGCQFDRALSGNGVDMSMVT